MKKLLILSCFLTAALFSMGQNSSADYFMNKSSMASSDSKIQVNANGDTIMVSGFNGQNILQNSRQSYEAKYMGTPYLNNGWYKGKMVLKGGEAVAGLMAYNLVQGSVYFSENPYSNAVELKPLEFNLNGHSFTSYKNEIKGAGDYYYETLVSTEPKLLKQYHCTYTRNASMGDNGGYGSTTASEYEGEFKKLDKFYIVLNNSMRLVTKKKSFLKSLGTYTKPAMAYVNAKKLNMKKQNDIIALARYLATIQ